MNSHKYSLKNKNAIITSILFSLLGILFYQCNFSSSYEPTITKDSTKLVQSSKITNTDSSSNISNSIKVIGQIENNLTLTIDSLKKMAVKDIKNYKVICGTGETKNTFANCKGVLLKDIIKKAGIKHLPDGNRNFNIIVTATDHYSACFTWAELNNTATGDNAYIIFEKDGKPIKNTGAMNLICSSDYKTAMRHIIWVKQIEIKPIN
jgi:hypothetical protein